MHLRSAGASLAAAGSDCKRDRHQDNHRFLVVKSSSRLAFECVLLRLNVLLHGVTVLMELKRCRILVDGKLRHELIQSVAR